MACGAPRQCRNDPVRPAYALGPLTGQDPLIHGYGLRCDQKMPNVTNRDTST